MEAVEALQFEAIPVEAPPHGPLAIELIPAPDPWQTALHLAHLPTLLFLDSAERHPLRGRYSYVAADGRLEILPSSPSGPKATRRDLQRLSEAISEVRVSRIPGLPPFQGGIAGLFSYEFAGALEALRRPACDAFAVPDWAIAQYDWVIAFDHLQNRAWIVSTGWESAVPPRLNRDYARSRLSAILQELRRPKMKPRPATIQSRVLVASDLSPHFQLSGFPGVSSNFDRSGFESAVQRAIDYIHAGDCFQVNLAQRLLAPLLEHPLDLYGRLRTINPAPFGAYFDLGDFQILSASPERFLQVSDRQVETRPIKGTRPRGKLPKKMQQPLGISRAMRRIVRKT